MSTASRLWTNRPWWAVGRTQWGGTPFSTLGVDWCCWCKMQVDTDTQAGHDQGVYVYRRTCKRCGRVVANGAVRAPLVLAHGAEGVTLPAKALRWIHDVGKDRSGKGHV